MRITPNIVDHSLGFTSGTDLFERKKFSNQLENIILKSNDENLVFAIDDKWGNGKTTFLKMWESENKLNQNPELEIVYYDAFQNDFQEDAFISITSKIYSLVESINPDKKKPLLDKAKAVGKTLFNITTKIGINLASTGILKDTDFSDSAGAVADSLSNPLDSYIEEKITKAKNDEDAIADFKKILEGISLNKKIVFIIDELDRARPDFSLEILEKLKHVFSVKNFIFILSMNRDQFEQSIIRRYGNIDAKLYLSKFITHWFNLPKTQESTYSKATIAIYNDKLYQDYFQSNIEYLDLKDTLTHLLYMNNRSLRDAERCWGIASLIVSADNNRMDESKQIAVGVVAYLIFHHPERIQEIIKKEINAHELVIQIRVNPLNGLTETRKRFSMIISHVIFTEFLSNIEYENYLSSSEIPRTGQRGSIISKVVHDFDFIHME